MDDVQVAKRYLSALRDIHATGAAVEETSYYPAISNLLDAIGNSLKPKVRCVMNLKNYGAGMPDGGLFTADQLRRSADVAIRNGQLPARGAIEAKGPARKLENLAASTQVNDYVGTYGIVLITNLREFAIVDDKGIREQFSLAGSADRFWEAVAAHPQAAADKDGKSLAEFLRRACLHDAPLTNPKDVAWFLASYARDALARVEQRSELPALLSVRTALQEALGMEFSGENGEHFFRSTLVQTLFYGLFSAWVQWARGTPSSDATFDWRSAEWTLHVPFIRSLYGIIARPEHLGRLGLVEPIDWASGALNRVDRNSFFRRFEDQHAVQYFYEPFLEAYDPELRKQFGVWYTPAEIVKYQVARVDRVLREELNLPDGLADPSVVVLDPCCGTGTYLVEVLRTIATTLRDRGGDALVAADLKDAARKRIFGFEIMPAPFVVAHLQLGLMLGHEGAPLDHDTSERVGVYLTNALTGWEASSTGAIQGILGSDLQVEKDAAEHVKREEAILVVIGNPPYNAFAGVSPAEERGLVEPYKGAYTVPVARRGRRASSRRAGPSPTTTRYRLNDPVIRGGWGIRKFNLDDLYVRFFRLAERRIAEMSGQGIISYISSYSYLSDPSFVIMRERFLAEFDRLWIDCMNGDSRETGKLTPEGLPDPSVFSTEQNREGIKVGTAVCTMVRKPQRQDNPTVLFRQFWGTTKREDLLATIEVPESEPTYSEARPTRENRFSFRPENVARNYASWPTLTALASDTIFAGIAEDRRKSLFGPDREVLRVRMQAYFGNASWDELKAIAPNLTRDVPRFAARDARARIKARESFSDGRLLPFALRPFDVQWCYYSPVRPLWREPRPEYWRAFQVSPRSIVSRFKKAKSPEGAPLTFASTLCDYHLMTPNSSIITMRLPSAPDDPNQLSLNNIAGPVANLSDRARSYLASLDVDSPDAHQPATEIIWMHALALGHSPSYLTDNADGIQRDWPRIPLPATRQVLQSSAKLGERVAALLDTEAEVSGATQGALSALMKSVGAIAKVGGGNINPAGDDLSLTANWGFVGQGGAIMPGGGHIEQRAFTNAEAATIAAEANTLGLTPEALTRLLGGETCDVYLNEVSFWRNVPLAVWDFYIGGYQVVKKWLSYRKNDVLGRALRVEEVREVTNMIRRLLGLVLLRPRLDANYAAVCSATYQWPGENSVHTVAPTSPALPVAAE